jgi:hypothetical protein
VRAIPVVCFEGAYGHGRSACRRCPCQPICWCRISMSPRLPGFIARLADNEQERIEIGEATRRVAANDVRHDQYVRRLTSWESRQLGIMHSVRKTSTRCATSAVQRQRLLATRSARRHEGRGHRRVPGALVRRGPASPCQRRTVCSGVPASASPPDLRAREPTIATTPHASTRSRISFAAASRWCVASRGDCAGKPP